MTQPIDIETMEKLLKTSFIGLEDTFRSEIKRMIEQMVLEVKEVQKAMNIMKTEISEQKKSMEFISECYDEMKKSNDKLVLDIKNERKERVQMEERLQVQINQLEAERRSCNLEMQGVEEKAEEDCRQVVSSVIDKATPDIQVSDIISAVRVGNKTNQDGSTKNRIILFRMKNKTTRDKIYSNRKNLKKLDGSPIYINENLSFVTKQLLFKTNKIRKEKEYKHLWTKNGSILIRKNDNSKVIAINSCSDLDKII